MKTLLLLLAIATVTVTTFVAPGCGTLHNQSKKPYPTPYGGVVAEFKDNHELYGPAVFPCMLISLPLTIAFDTLTLPADIYATATATNK